MQADAVALAVFDKGREAVGDGEFFLQQFAAADHRLLRRSFAVVAAEKQSVQPPQAAASEPSSRQIMPLTP